MATIRNKPRPAPQTPPTPAVVRLVSWTLLWAIWLMIAAALVSYDSADWPNPSVVPHNEPLRNLIGPVGAYVAHKAYFMLGPGVWIAMAGTLAGLMCPLISRPITQPVLRFSGLLLMAVAVSSIISLQLPDGFLGVGQRPEGSGGLLALFIAAELHQRFGLVGSMIVLVVGFWVGALIAVDELIFAVARWLRTVGSAIVGNVRIPRPALAGSFPSLWTRRQQREQLEDQHQDALDSDEFDDDPEVEAVLDDDEPADADTSAAREQLPSAVDPSLNQALASAIAAHEAASKYDPEIKPAASNPVESELDDDDASDEPAADAPGAYIAEKKQFTPDELRAKMKQLPINFAPVNKNKAVAPPREVDLSGYRFPEMSLLEEPESSFTQEMEQIVREQAMLLESALQQYKIQGNVVGIDSGPVITLFEVSLAAGTKVAALNAISSDLARSLKAQNIRIVPNMAGKDTVGIEVPNVKKEKVRLKELMTADPDLQKKMKLPMWLGKDASGNPLIADLTTMPHMLIAGTTGSGKSVCMNSIIMSFLFTKRPDELKLVLVDPKMVEMSMYRDVPHLACPVVTEMAKATAILEWATTKMDERYELLAEAGVRDIATYNELGWEELKERFQPANESEEAAIPRKLPYYVFVIDELADLMMTNKEVEGHIVRIAQKARAVGMHLILATQRPQANVVTGLIKGNMPCRVSFKVASRLDSRIVLDQSGAELLLGHGDMLFLSPRTSKILRSQGTLVDDIEIRRTVKFLKQVAEPSFEPQLVQIKAAGLAEETEERDPLFDEAVRVVLQTKRGSVSLLQRRLTVGYSRASRIIEQMAQAGILGDYKGSQAREVTMTLEEYEALMAQAEQDAADGMVGIDRSAEESDDADDDSVPDEMDDEYRR